MTKYYREGAVVLSTAGRDQNQIFIIKSVEGNYAYIIDGKSKTIENPKKKNLKHLHLLCKSEKSGLDMSNLTNAHTIKYLKDYSKSKE